MREVVLRTIGLPDQPPIARQGQTFVREQLTPEALSCYWLGALQRYAGIYFLPKTPAQMAQEGSGQGSSGGQAAAAATAATGSGQAAAAAGGGGQDGGGQAAGAAVAGGGRAGGGEGSEGEEHRLP